MQPDPAQPPTSPIPGADPHDAVRVLVAMHDIACPSCGFNLRGCAEARCPECGECYGAYLALGAPVAAFTDRWRVTRIAGGAFLQIVGAAHLATGVIGLVAAIWSEITYGLYNAWTIVAVHLCAGAAAASALVIDEASRRGAAFLPRTLAQVIVLIVIALVVVVSLAPGLLSLILEVL